MRLSLLLLFPIYLFVAGLRTGRQAQHFHCCVSISKVPASTYNLFDNPAVVSRNKLPKISRTVSGITLRLRRIIRAVAEACLSLMYCHFQRSLPLLPWSSLSLAESDGSVEVVWEFSLAVSSEKAESLAPSPEVRIRGSSLSS